jgi:hypothetical protein
MNKIQSQLEEAAKSLNVSISELSSDESQKIRDNVIQKFAQENENPLWEYLNDSVATQNPESWRWIGEFVGNEEVIMFFNPAETNSFFSFQNGSQVVPVLEHAPSFEFYLTNARADYLICFNHHDYLIVSGAAQEWLEKKLDDKG